MLAVHFGAGNIGRGFIGQLLYNSNYEVYFVDVNPEIINLLNEKRCYSIVTADSSKNVYEIKNVKGINSITNADEVIEAIEKANIITTAVGANILPKIANLIAKGLEQRYKKSNTHVNIIACENMIGGSDYLKEHILNLVEDKSKIEKLTGFPNSAVDRIVPLQENDDKLLVQVEPFYEWVVDKSAVKGELPEIAGVKFVDKLLPYIERKLFTVNTGHAVTAYAGYSYKYKTIDEAIADGRIELFVKNVLQETGELIVKKYNFSKEEHDKYINKIIERFKNPHISDDISRVARSPIRKIGRNDRLLKPACELLELGINPKYLAKSIALAILYKNDNDPEAVELEEFLKSNSVEDLLVKYSELDKSSELVALVKNEYNNL